MTKDSAARKMLISHGLSEQEADEGIALLGEKGARALAIYIILKEKKKEKNMTADEQAVATKSGVSPLPWEVARPTGDHRGEAVIRCHDVDDDILGEVIADIMNAEDATHIVNMVNTGKKKISSTLPSDVVELLQRVYITLYREYDSENIDLEAHASNLDDLKSSLRLYGESVPSV